MPRSKFRDQKKPKKKNGKTVLIVTNLGLLETCYQENQREKADLTKGREGEIVAQVGLMGVWKDGCEEFHVKGFLISSEI